MIVLRRRANAAGDWEYYTGREYLWTRALSTAKQYVSEQEANDQRCMVGGIVHSEENNAVSHQTNSK